MRRHCPASPARWPVMTRSSRSCASAAPAARSKNCWRMPAEGGAGAGSARPPRRGDIPHQNKKVVLAYSGGLDTSVAIRWLKDEGWDVIAFTVDLGEKKDLDAIQTRALKTGASAAYVADGRLPFIQLFVWPSLQAGAVFGKENPLAPPLGGPLNSAPMGAGAPPGGRPGRGARGAPQGK